MHTKQQIRNFLEYQAYRLRLLSLEMTTKAGSGHPSSCLSGADLVAALFFYAMRYYPDKSEFPTNDRFILSKGHAAPLLYAAWHLAGAVSLQELMNYRSIDSVLEGHPTLRFSRAEAATGSLGMGLSIGAGMAQYSVLFKVPFKTYVLMGDSEITEGSIWEAAEIAAHYKLDNLIGIVDCNRLGQSTQAIHGTHAQRYADKFSAFGWKSIVIDGHDMLQIMNALDRAHETVGQPVMIIAKTLKGYGVDQIENKEGFHGKAFSQQELPKIVAQLKERFAFQASFNLAGYGWQPILPQSYTARKVESKSVQEPDFKQGTMVATRKAYGLSLARLGAEYHNLVALDAEVKNSTYADIFESHFPERFIQCYIAEQNMVTMGVGLQRRGAMPFISTFGAFFSRAYDQIRMAAIGQSSLRLVGSHAGISIGQDGPSQMALEDIALMRALPESTVLYPCDAVATHALVGLMATYTQGISYLRTTRMETPVIYSNDTSFVAGGSHILRQSAHDKACIVAAGITVHEALKAHELLAGQGIAISVIDAYSIKPLDLATIERVARASNIIVSVEDHYLQGGLGEALCAGLNGKGIDVSCLAVEKLPRSGKPEELMAWAGIDADAIVRRVRALIK